MHKTALNPAINFLLSIETKGIKLGLKRTKEIMSACGNPHAKLPVIQVAGTNGKGSVCAILDKIFRLSNYKTGLFTSPHLVNVNERIRINGQPIKNVEIEKFINTYKNEIEKLNVTFFECITAMSAWYFANNQVDVAIMETGLGGRLDSVSICNPIMTIFTPISLDHTEILGNTLKKIALEKSGIMKNNVTSVSSQQKDDAKSVLKKEAIKKNVPLYFLDKSKILDYDFNIKGQQQRENASLALYALNYLKNYNITESAKKNALKCVTWYGRNQIIKKNPTIVFDVGHNVSGIKSFIQYYSTLNISGKSTLVIALYSRKKIYDVIGLLEKTFEKIICTKTNGKNPMPAINLLQQFSQTHDVQIINDPYMAISSSYNKLNKNDGLVILGTHCLGPAISTFFNISFDTI